MAAVLQARRSGGADLCEGADTANPANHPGSYSDGVAPPTGADGATPSGGGADQAWNIGCLVADEKGKEGRSGWSQRGIT